MIRTVLGDIAPDTLGVTMAHEHLLMTGGWPIRQEPDFRLDSVDAAVAEVEPYTALGGQAVVEMTPFGFGRSAAGLTEISRRTGMHIVACTGFHKLAYYADNHWLHRYSAEQIAQLLMEEVEFGMDEHGLEGPLRAQVAARAGVIKLATEYHKAGPVIEKLAEAIGATHARTGVPIATHTEKGTMGHVQLDMLEKAGVPADAVILGHIDHNPDAALLAELAARGAYLACDMPGRTKYGPDSQVIELLTHLVDAGHSNRILLGSDLARRSYWTTLGGGPGLGYLLGTFVPRLRAVGLGELPETALVSNPARAFSLRKTP
jgi:predicted metal-dependent phosphotriesterase family hydrolase